MSVETVVGDVGLSTLEPLDVDRAFTNVVVEFAYGVPFFEPVVFGGFFRPESIGVFD